LQLASDSISEIHLGWRFDPSQINEKLKSLCKFFPKAAIYRLFPDEESYLLKPKLLNV